MEQQVECIAIGLLHHLYTRTKDTQTYVWIKGDRGGLDSEMQTAEIESGNRIVIITGDKDNV